MLHILYLTNRQWKVDDFLIKCLLRRTDYDNTCRNVFLEACCVSNYILTRQIALREAKLSSRMKKADSHWVSAQSTREAVFLHSYLYSSPNTRGLCMWSSFWSQSSWTSSNWKTGTECMYTVTKGTKCFPLVLEVLQDIFVKILLAARSRFWPNGRGWKSYTLKLSLKKASLILRELIFLNAINKVTNYFFFCNKKLGYSRPLLLTLF